MISLSKCPVTLFSRAYALLSGTVAATLLSTAVVTGAFGIPAALADSATPKPHTSSGEPAPRVVVPQLAFDFGKVNAGTIVERTFILQNAGSAPLKIERIHAACGCTAAMIDTDTVQPGAEAKVKTSFDTTGFQGAKVKTVRIYTNDPRQSSLVLSLKGTVQSEIEIQPMRLFFGDVSKGEQRSMSAEVITAPGSDFKILEVNSRSQFIDARLEEGKAGSNPKIVATIRPQAPVGVLRERIVVRTSSSKAAVLNLPVFARIQGDLQLVPSAVSFGLVEGPLTGPVIQEVKLVNRSSASLKITSVESDNPLVTAELVRPAAQEGKGSMLKVVLREGLFGAFRAKILVNTDNPDAEQRQLTLPVYGIVSRRGS